MPGSRGLARARIAKSRRCATTWFRRLKRDFPQARFVLNGGLTSLDGARRSSEGLDGVMLGRAAYHDPYLLAAVDAEFFGESSAPRQRGARSLT